MENGASAETAITGNEGCIGIASITGGDPTPIRTIVQHAGYAYRIKAEIVKKEFERSGPLQHLLLRYTQALLTQITQTAACNGHHLLEQQLCRLLLLCVDRLVSNELTMTQDLIACMLGVRRDGVAQAAGKLQKAGLIDYRRGRITVLDRPNLEARACECYAVVKRELDCPPPIPHSLMTRLPCADTKLGIKHTSRRADRIAPIRMQEEFQAAALTAVSASWRQT